MPSEQDVQAPVFEVGHFGLRGNRLRIEGRWSGVRGLRFVRPTLTLVSDDGRRRLLASLEDKPWSPDVDTWVASFPFEGRELVADGAELAVGPALVVDLPAPEGARRPRPRSDGGRFATATASEPRDALAAARDAATAERDVLRAELAEAIAERDRLREELGAAHGSGGAEKERAKRALADLAAERDTLRRELEAVAARESEREAALARELEAAVEKRDEARERIAQLETERDEAVERATMLQAERIAAVSVRDEAVKDREASLRAQPVAPMPTPAPGTIPAHLRAQRDAPSVRNSWLMRVTASLAAIIVLIVAALLLTN